MPNIRSLFDPELPIDRPIEKVITFSNRQPEVLVHEAREYVLTNNLSNEYEKLLGYFEDAQAGDRGKDCCVWLSGFYGSGKSSFAKYFGLTFDPTAVSGDTHFSDHFLKQFPSKPFQTHLKAVRSKFDVAVFLLDLASQGTAGVTHTPISTLLFDQVCAWAGFASDRKIAELETFLLHEGKLEEFHQRAEAETGLTYDELASLPGILLLGSGPRVLSENLENRRGVPECHYHRYPERSRARRADARAHREKDRHPSGPLCRR
jgi:hypothetical protein